MLDEHPIIVGDVTLNLAIGPANGPPLLLLPGFTSTWASYEPILPTFIPSWHVHALDYRGHGKSSRVPGHYRALDYLDDARRVLHQCFEEPVAVLGLSMGGWLALALAESVPEHVRAIIVGDTSLDIEGYKRLMPDNEVREISRVRQEVAGHPINEILPMLAARGIPPEEAPALSQLDPHVLDLQVAGDATYFAGVGDVDLKRITCPVLFIQGNPTLGGMLSEADVQRALATTPNASHAYIDHAGHDLGFSDGNLEPFLDAVSTFLNDL